MPNEILKVINGVHPAWCLCDNCKVVKMNRYLNTTRQELKRIAFADLKVDEEARLNALLENTVKQIAAIYAYRTKCVGAPPRPSFGVWLKNNSNPAIMTKKRRGSLVRLVREACAVYEEWPTIVENLSFEGLRNLDARRFCIRKFYDARRLQWCEDEEQRLSSKAKRRRDREGFDAVKFENVVTLVRTSGLLDDVSFCPRQGELIAKKFKMEIDNICIENNAL